MRVGAELLEHDDLDVDPREIGGRERRVLERLGPDAEDHRADAVVRGRRDRSSGMRNCAERDLRPVDRRFDEVHRTATR